MMKFLEDRPWIGFLVMIVLVFGVGGIAKEVYKDSKYDYNIRSSFGKIWVNQNEIEQKGDTLIIHHEDGKTSVLTSYQIEDNRDK